MSRRALIVVGAIASVLLLATGVIAGMLIAGDDEDRAEVVRGERPVNSSTVVEQATGWLGLNVASNINGPRVTSVEPSGPSERAGLQVNDIIRSVNGVIVRSPGDLLDSIASRKAGERVSLTIERSNAEVRTDVTLAPAPANAKIDPAPVAPSQPPGPVAPSSAITNAALFVFPVLTNQMRSGLVFEPITDELKQNYALQRDSGYVVVNVAPQSHGLRAGFQEGDVLLAIGGTALPDTDSPAADETIARLFDNLPAGRPINFRILRGNKETAIPLALPARQDLPSLDGAPPGLRLMLETMVDAGAVSYEQAKTLLSSGQSQSVRVGRIKDVDSTRISLAISARSDEITIVVTPDTRFQRGQTSVNSADLNNGEVVMVMSIDGGKTALAVFLTGFEEPSAISFLHRFDD